MQIAVIVGLIALLKKAMDFIKYAANWEDGKNGVVTQVCHWLLGAVGGLLVFTQQFAQKIDVGSVQIGKVSGAGQAFLGVLMASIASVTHDWIKARDNTDSAKVPSLLKNKNDLPQAA